MPENLCPERAQTFLLEIYLMLTDGLREEANIHTGRIHFHLLRAAKAFDKNDDFLAEKHIAKAVKYCARSPETVNRIESICTKIKEHPEWMR